MEHAEWVPGSNFVRRDHSCVPGSHPIAQPGRLVQATTSPQTDHVRTAFLSDHPKKEENRARHLFAYLIGSWMRRSRCQDGAGRGRTEKPR